MLIFFYPAFRSLKIVEPGRDEIFCKMPLVRLVPVHEEEEKEDEEEDGSDPSYPCPLFQNSERSGDENFIMELGLPCEREPEVKTTFSLNPFLNIDTFFSHSFSQVWALSGVALLCQEPKDR